MSYDDGKDIGLTPEHEIRHYHGDKTRLIFVACALLLIVAQSTGADLPFSTVTAVVYATVLAIAAGVTNPRQTEIHWFSGILSLIGTLVFGISAVSHYRAGTSIGTVSFMYIEALALLSIVALYLSTKTIRGRMHFPPK